MLANIHQVYFDEKSKSNCFDEWNAYDNSNKLTEFFENTVIVDLIDKGEHLKSEYFGVFSHDAKSHIRFSEGELFFNPVNVDQVMKDNPDIDIFGFEKRRKQVNIIHQAETYHKGFVKLIENILEETNFLPEIPVKLPNIILFNHFIARSEIYQAYVEELLKPAMKVLRDCPEAYKDAKYKRVEGETANRFRNAFGESYYPFHPFICERLPSLFMYKYNFSFKQIF